eukprot:2883470-Lingulodinium_polyedra.AAC.1
MASYPSGEAQGIDAASAIVARRVRDAAPVALLSEGAALAASSAAVVSAQPAEAAPAVEWLGFAGRPARGPGL